MRIYSPATNSPLKNTHAEGQQKIGKTPLSGSFSADFQPVKTSAKMSNQTTHRASSRPLFMVFTYKQALMLRHKYPLKCYILSYQDHVISSHI